MGRPSLVLAPSTLVGELPGCRVLYSGQAALACSSISVLLGVGEGGHGLWLSQRGTPGGELESALSLNPSLVLPPASATHSHFQGRTHRQTAAPGPPSPCPTSPSWGGGRSGRPEVPSLEGAKGEVGLPAPARAKGSPRDSTPTRRTNFNISLAAASLANLSCKCGCPRAREEPAPSRKAAPDWWPRHRHL